MRTVARGGQGLTSATRHAPPRTERELRYRRLRHAMHDASLDGLLAFAPGWRREHVHYLAGAGVRASFAFAYLPLAGDPLAFVAGAADAAGVAAAGWVADVRPLAGRGVAAAIAAGRPARLGVAHLELRPRCWSRSGPASTASRSSPPPG